MGLNLDSKSKLLSSFCELSFKCEIKKPNWIGRSWERIGIHLLAIGRNNKESLPAIHIFDAFEHGLACVLPLKTRVKTYYTTMSNDMYIFKIWVETHALHSCFQELFEGAHINRNALLGFLFP